MKCEGPEVKLIEFFALHNKEQVFITLIYADLDIVYLTDSQLADIKWQA